MPDVTGAPLVGETIAYGTQSPMYPWGADPFRTPWPTAPQSGVIRPVGGDYQPTLIEGLTDKLTSQEALLQQAVQELRSQTVALQANARYATGSSSPVGRTAVVTPTATTADPTAEKIRAQAREAMAPFQPSPAAEGNVETTQEIMDREGPRGVRESRFLSNLSMENQHRSVREQVSEGIASRISRFEWGEQLEQDDAGLFHDPETGRFVSRDRVQGFLRRDALVRGAQGFAGRIAEGETIAGAAQGSLGGLGTAGGIPFGTIAKGLGVAGLAYQGATQLRDFANGQREANASWQRISGGTNAGGFAERGRSQLFEMQQSWFGGMGAGEAERLYQGAAEIYGTQDRRSRQEAQEFGTEMWRELGIEVSESLRMIQEAARDGNDDLGSLAESLHEVSDAAADAGMSAGVGREIFERQLGAVGQNTTGAAANIIAGAVGQAQASMGNQFADLDLSQLESQNALVQQAQLMGMDFGTFMAQRETDPTVAGQATQKYIQNYVGGQLNDPRAQRLIADAIARSPDGRLGEGDFERLSRNLEDAGAVDPRAMAGILNSTIGTGHTLGNATEAGLRMLYQESWQLGDQLNKRNTAREFTREEREHLEAWSNNDGTYNEDKFGDLYKHLEENAGIKVGDHKNQMNAKGEDKAYLERIGAGKEGSQYIEGLMADEGLGNHARYTVETKDGKRDVTLSELIRDYPNQVPNAIISRGPQGALGQKVSEHLKLAEVDTGPLPEGRSGWDPDKGKINEGGIYDEDAAGKNGRVEIVPSPELARLIRLNPSGNAWTSSQYQGGVTPLPDPSSAKSGTPGG